MPLQIAEIPQFTTETKGKLILEQMEKRTARGIYTGAKLSLYPASHQTVPKSSVFIYPATYVLTPSRILERDRAFSDIFPAPLVIREFKDASMEELEKLLITATSPAQFQNKKYSLPLPRLWAYLFDAKAAEYLTGVIKDLHV